MAWWRPFTRGYRPRRMRPVTAVIIAGLLVLIVGAFLLQVYLAGGL